jgi:hypothetical protein
MEHGTFRFLPIELADLNARQPFPPMGNALAVMAPPKPF